MPRSLPIALVAAVVLAFASAASAAPSRGPAAKPPANPPNPIQLRSGWEVRDVVTPPTPVQPGPPEETDPTPARVAARAPAQAAQSAGGWRAARVPSVFEGLARAAQYGGSVRRYRLRFTAPDVAGYTWAFRFDEVRRRATAFLNGRRIGISIDPYTPFQIPALGLRPGKVNTLEVEVDSRKNPALAEGWWNWGGIVRPVSLVPIGSAYLADLGLMPSVICHGPATYCSGALLLDGVLGRLPAERPRKVRRGGKRVTLPDPQPRVVIWLRSPSGRVTRRAYDVRGSRTGRRRIRIQAAVPAPELWSPDHPRLYSARVAIRYDGRTVQLVRRKIGMRSVTVRDGMLRLNNRVVNLRGASIHEDFPGHGAALTGHDMDTIVRELKELGANVTRAHYVLSEGLLRRFDRAGIMVYDEAPVWQRDARPNLLRRPIDRVRAIAEVRRTVIASRSHPSVIAHSVANELAFTPDTRPPTRLFLLGAAKAARDLDPLVPIALDIKTRPVLPRQSTYDAFDLIGINQYFGWYPWVPDFAQLEPFLRQMRANYPEQALVMTEFGAEGRPDMAFSPADEKGSYGFQANHVARTVDLVDRLPFMSGAIHWTLREFEIFPGWRGGAVNGAGPNDNIRHHKGVLTYGGARKPAWKALHDRFVKTPLYR